MRSVSASTFSGVIGPASVIVKASASAARRSTPAGQVDQAVDRLDPQLVVDELDDEAHDRGRAGIVDPCARGARRGSSARSRTGDGRRRARAAPRRRCAVDRGDGARGRRSRPARGARRSSSVHDASGVARSSRAVRPAPRVRPQIGSTFTRIACRSDEPVRLRLRQRPLVGEDVVGAGIGQPERADDAAGVTSPAVIVAVLHPVRVEAGRRVGHQDARRVATSRTASAARAYRSPSACSSRGRINRTELRGCAASSAACSSSSTTS